MDRNNLLFKIIIWIIYIIFILLIFKNPYSGKNNISDFTPLPDSIHYISPALNVASGNGLEIIYEGRKIKPAVPPLYSLFLTPFYVISKDARSFYFANILLSVLSLGLFYLILSRLKLHALLILLSFFAFATNYVVFWYPSIPMSENLFLPLYLLSVWVLLTLANIRNIIIAGFLCVSFYATKYIAVILSLIFGLTYLYKICYSLKNKKKIYLLVSIFIVSVLIPYLLYDAYEFLNKESHLIPLVYLPEMFKLGVAATLSTALPPPSSSYYSINNISSNFSQYLAGFIGGELRVAGQYFVIMSPVIGMIGLIGLLLNPFLSKFKLISVYFLISFSSVFIIACFFYIIEGRYLFFAVPVFILSFALLVDYLWTFFNKIGKKYLIYLTAVILLVLIFISQIPPVFKELTKGGSTINYDRNYAVISMLNSYFKNIPDNKNIAVISVIPPYIFDYYNKPNYTLLPLSSRQTFMGSAEITWGKNDYSDLIGLYKKYLNSDYTLYLSSFKAKDSSPVSLAQFYIFYQDFQKISENFNLEKIADGCDGKCDLYKLNLK